MRGAGGDLVTGHMRKGLEVSHRSSIRSPKLGTLVAASLDVSISGDSAAIDQITPESTSPTKLKWDGSRWQVQQVGSRDD